MDNGIALTSAEIRDVYMRGPPSCLTMPTTAYKTAGAHPLGAIPDNLDLGVAYTQNYQRVLIRALIHLPTKSFHYPYLAKRHREKHSEFVTWLLHIGYHFSDGYEWFGARLKRVEIGQNFLCPGLDPPRGFVWDDGTYLRLGFPLTKDDMRECLAICAMNHDDGLAYPIGRSRHP